MVLLEGWLCVRIVCGLEYAIISLEFASSEASSGKI
jgi:hypothetical protein